MSKDEFPKLVFDVPSDGHAEFETPRKGWFGAAKVVLRDGSTYAVMFYDAGRLGQDLQDEISSGRTCLAYAGLIVLPEVTLENMQAAVRQLADEGYFAGLTPI